MDDRLVDESLLFAGNRVNQRGKECLRAVRHGEGELADVLSDTVQCGHAGGFGEDAGSKGDVDVFKEVRGGANTEIMARQAKSGKIFFGNGGEESGPGFLRQPELEKVGMRHEDEGSYQVSTIHSKDGQDYASSSSSRLSG